MSTYSIWASHVDTATCDECMYLTFYASLTILISSEDSGNFKINAESSVSSIAPS